MTIKLIRNLLLIVSLSVVGFWLYNPHLTAVHAMPCCEDLIAECVGESSACGSDCAANYSQNAADYTSCMGSCQATYQHCSVSWCDRCDLERDYYKPECGPYNIFCPPWEGSPCSAPSQCGFSGWCSANNQCPPPNPFPQPCPTQGCPSGTTCDAWGVCR